MDPIEGKVHWVIRRHRSTLLPQPDYCAICVSRRIADALCFKHKVCMHPLCVALDPNGECEIFATTERLPWLQDLSSPSVKAKFSKVVSAKYVELGYESLMFSVSPNCYYENGLYSCRVLCAWQCSECGAGFKKEVKPDYDPDQIYFTSCKKCGYYCPNERGVRALFQKEVKNGLLTPDHIVEFHIDEDRMVRIDLMYFFKPFEFV